MHITIEELFNKVIASVMEKCKEQGKEDCAVAVAVELTSYYPAVTNWAGIEPGSWSIRVSTIGDAAIVIGENGNHLCEYAALAIEKIMSCKNAYVAADASEYYDFSELWSNSHLISNQTEVFHKWKGGIAIPVGRLCGDPCCNMGEDAFVVYVGVSGGTEEEDEAAVLSAVPTVAGIIGSEDGYMLHRVVYDYMRENNIVASAM